MRTVVVVGGGIVGLATAYQLQRSRPGLKVLLVEKESGLGRHQTGHNSGVYIRTAADGSVWHQAQVAHLDKPPLLGDLFGETRVDGQVQHFQMLGKGHELARPPGEWRAPTTKRQRSVE